MSIAARLNSRITQLAVGRYLPHRTVRLRLTLLYGGLFLLSGAALVAITYVLFQQATEYTKPHLPNVPRTPAIQHLPAIQNPGFPTPLAQALRQLAKAQYELTQAPSPNAVTVPPALAQVQHRLAQAQHQLTQGQHQLAEAQHQLAQAVHQVAQTGAVEAAQRAADSHQLLVNSGTALAIVAVLALLAGWLVAGRVLQPLEDSYRAQRQFVANASHELRAPLTRQRALIQVALADPQAGFSSLRAAHERVLASEQHLEQMIAGLLTLTRGQAGLERNEPVDLAALTSQAMLARESQLAELDLNVRATLDTAPTAGDPRLLESLIANLIDNAMRYNTPGGHVEVSTGIRERRAFVSFANTGPPVPPEQIQRLLQPFQRLGGARTSHDSHGLGLSIVQAIANAHRAELSARARPEGGLTIEVSFPSTIGAGSKVTFPTAWKKRGSPRTSVGD